MTQSEDPLHVLCHVQDRIVVLAKENHAVLSVDNRGRPVVGQRLNRVHVHNEAVRKFACVVEVYEQLDRFYIAFKVANILIPDFPDIPSESVLHEPLHE
jgi:hypothetical protein